MNNHRLALYLAGKFPPYFQAPIDRYQFILIARSVSDGGLTTEMTNEIRDYAKSDDDFFLMVLNTLQKLNENYILELIRKLEIQLPEDISPLSSLWRPSSKKEFENLLDCFDEIPATEEIIAPLLTRMLGIAIPRGHEVKQGEYGHDFHIIPYNTPLFTRYIGVQVKKGSISQTTALKAIEEVASQLNTAVRSTKISTDSRMILVNDMVIVTLGKIPGDVRKIILDDYWTNKNVPLIFIDRDELYQLVLKYGLPKEPIPRKVNKIKKAK